MKALKYRELDVADLAAADAGRAGAVVPAPLPDGMGQTEGLKKYRELKKDRARMLTVLKEKKADGDAAAQVAGRRRRAEKTAGQEEGSGRSSK